LAEEKEILKGGVEGKKRRKGRERGKVEEMEGRERRGDGKGGRVKAGKTNGGMSMGMGGNGRKGE